MKKPDKNFDAIYAKKNNSLEQKNSDIRNKIDTYDKSLSIWESFRCEFNHDRDELGKALRGLKVYNNK